MAIVCNAVCAFWRFCCAVSYFSSRMEVCCSSWASVASIWLTCDWVELICAWFGAGPGKRGGCRRARVRRGRRRKQRGEQADDQRHPDKRSPPADSAPTHSLYPRRASVMAAWWQFRHPLCFRSVASRVRAVFTLRSSIGSIVASIDRRHLCSIGSTYVKGVVAVAQGRLRGVWRGDLWSFSGIPYGRAPTGALRWRPPLEAERWSEIRDASTFGPIAPQSAAVPGSHQPGGSGGLRAAQRGLPVAQRLDARTAGITHGGARARPPGNGLHPRGWVHFGERVGVPVPGRGIGAQRRRRGRDHQLPARRAWASWVTGIWPIPTGWSGTGAYRIS